MIDRGPVEVVVQFLLASKDKGAIDDVQPVLVAGICRTNKQADQVRR